VPGYTAGEVSKLLGLSIGRIRSFVRSGLLEPDRGGRGEQLFGFQDLVLLRTAKGLLDARIPERRVKLVLKILKEKLPLERPLSGVQIAADGTDIVVRDGAAKWNAESGQSLFDFEVDELRSKVAPLAKKAADEARKVEDELRAADWFALGLELEQASPSEARDAYRRALELDPANADARVNLGRLLHEVGELEAAEAHYRMALEVRPDDATAMFNLGVVLEDLERFDEAVHVYETAIGLDAGAKDAYWNLAQLCERLGREKAAIRWLAAYKRLT
jgi:tetratricopeptide (TPR) repeat protein